MNAKDETGNIYGHLVVRKKYVQKGKHGAVRWVCECSCGNYVVYTGAYLRSRKPQDCGCGVASGGHPRKIFTLKHEKGKRYGKLVVVERVSSYRGAGRWLCRCDCGNELVVMGRDLRSGKRLHCGCETNGDLVKYWKDVAEWLAARLEETTETSAVKWLDDAQVSLRSRR